MGLAHEPSERPRHRALTLTDPLLPPRRLGIRVAPSATARSCQRLVRSGLTLGQKLRKRAARRADLLRAPRHVERVAEAIRGRLERLHASALGFRNLTKYIARRLPASEGSGPTTPLIGMSPFGSVNPSTVVQLSAMFW